MFLNMEFAVPYQHPKIQFNSSIPYLTFSTEVLHTPTSKMEFAIPYYIFNMEERIPGVLIKVEWAAFSYWWSAIVRIHLECPMRLHCPNATLHNIVSNLNHSICIKCYMYIILHFPNVLFYNSVPLIHYDCKVVQCNVIE